MIAENFESTSGRENSGGTALPSDSHLRSCVPDTCNWSFSLCGQVRPDAIPPQA